MALMMRAKLSSSKMGTKEVGVVTEFFGRTGRFLPKGEPYLWYTVVIKPVEPDDTFGGTARGKMQKKGHDEVLERVEKTIAEGKDPFVVLSVLHSWDE